MKRYRDLNSYLREIFGVRVQKIAIDAGFSCPNRDGTISHKGCIYCDSRGSGTGAYRKGISIREQVERAREYLRKRYKAKKFIAYFQAFTNTYADLDELKRKYDEALCFDDIVGISIGTRPDCIDEEKLKLISSYKERYMVWIEYGLQSAHNRTLRLINRGHDRSCFEKAVYMTKKYGINVCAHIILGLPGETKEMMIETARYLSSIPVDGVKIHMLYVVKGTELERMYRRGEVRLFEMEEYADIVCDFLEHLRPEIVIQRLTSDPPRDELVAPGWLLEKGKVINLIEKKLEERGSFQGNKLDLKRNLLYLKD